MEATGPSIAPPSFVCLSVSLSLMLSYQRSHIGKLCSLATWLSPHISSQGSLSFLRSWWPVDCHQDVDCRKQGPYVGLRINQRARATENRVMGTWLILSLCIRNPTGKRLPVLLFLSTGRVCVPEIPNNDPNSTGILPLSHTVCTIMTALLYKDFGAQGPPGCLCLRGLTFSFVF